MSDDERMEQLLREMAGGYHAPPPTPRDAIWARLVDARRARAERTGSPRRVVPIPVWRVAAAIAAVLVVGIAIGRFTAPEGTGSGPVVAASGDAVGLTPESQVAYRVVASEHLANVETFLMLFRTAARTGRLHEGDYVRSARGLLLQTRLLRDSPITADLALSTLLDDVELVLAQIASFTTDDADDLEFINQGIEQRGVLLKLRSAIPAGPARVAAQGA